MTQSKKYKSLIRVMTVGFGLGISISLSPFILGQSNLYRYINDRGVVVMDYSIPSKYVAKGYEVINSKGQVIRKIEPAPTEAEADKKKHERQVLDTFELLKRRYSNTADIEKAKERKLEGLTTNISILNSNISGLQSNIENLVSEAAQYERLGKKIPNNLLNVIADTKSELKVAQELLQIREKEHEETNRKYDIDIEHFLAGAKLQERLDSLPQ